MSDRVPLAGAMPSNHSSIIERLRHSQPSLTKSERRLARALFASNLLVGLESIAKFAEQGAVSAPTVLRFTAKLGFMGYPEFQRALRGELAERISSPLSMIASKEPADMGAPALQAAKDDFARGLNATLHADQAAEFDSVVDLLRRDNRRLHLLGGRFTRLIAEILWAHLWQLRKDVHLVQPWSIGFEPAALEMGRGDVLIVFDVRRYQPDIIAFAKLVHAQGTKAVLLTDPWMSPIAEFAEHVLTCDVECLSPFDSLVPCLALVEALVSALTVRFDLRGRERVSRLEKMRTVLGNAKSAEADVDRAKLVEGRRARMTTRYLGRSSNRSRRRS